MKKGRGVAREAWAGHCPSIRVEEVLATGGESVALTFIFDALPRRPCPTSRLNRESRTTPGFGIESLGGCPGKNVGWLLTRYLGAAMSYKPQPREAVGEMSPMGETMQGLDKCQHVMFHSGPEQEESLPVFFGVMNGILLYSVAVQ